MKKYLLLSILVTLIYCTSFAQKNSDPVRIDKNGRMIWKNTNQEAFFWGVNYTTPFAHAYRQIARMGEDREKVIDADTYHLSRLGTNAYRIHVWDREISDSIGNLIQNEHLKLLDYVIYRFQQRGVYVFLTPIAYWGNGYPERDEKLPGFSGKYNKGNVYILPEAIAAQERYLKQFLDHVNPYTGKAYKNDPMIVGIEVCNEPGHSKAAETTAFVQKMKAAIKSTGCTKPVFYNVTQSINLLEDFIKGGTDGVTFQWYPTGLVANHEQKGNFLPHIDRYYLPFKDEKYFLPQAKIVYEFDADDVGVSYLYPPMALSFKEAGMQWATMFSYDPIALAPSNTEYQTHFLNLAYSPQKAIGYKIASELFRNPKYKRDRINEIKPFEMNGVKIDYPNDLSELSTNDLFFYTNNTTTKPENLVTLKSIAGYGTSSIVSYKGYGAYFLDKISDGVWRLELMPDVICVHDLFTKATPLRDNVVIKWINYKMGIHLPNLGDNFSVTGINEGNTYLANAENGQFSITPGAYILSTKPVTEAIKNEKIGVITANEFYAPKETNKKFYFLQNAPDQVTEGQSFDVTVRVITPATPIKKLVIQSFVLGNRERIMPGSIPVVMEKTDEYQYKATIPNTLVKPGTFTFNIIAESISGKTTVYPSGFEGSVRDWNYVNPDWYSVRIVPATSEVQLFNPEKSGQTIIFTSNSILKRQTVPTGIVGESMLQFYKSEVLTGDNRPDTLGMICAIQNYIGDVIGGISKNASSYKHLLIYGKASDSPVEIEVTLINKDGNAYVAKATLTAGQDHQIINLKDMTNSNRMFLLPTPCPGFLSYWYTSKNMRPFNLSEIERIQVLVPKAGNTELPGFELSSITVK